MAASRHPPNGRLTAAKNGRVVLGPLDSGQVLLAPLRRCHPYASRRHSRNIVGILHVVVVQDVRIRSAMHFVEAGLLH